MTNKEQLVEMLDALYDETLKEEPVEPLLEVDDEALLSSALAARSWLHARDQPMLAVDLLLDVEDFLPVRGRVAMLAGMDRALLRLRARSGDRKEALQLLRMQFDDLDDEMKVLAREAIEFWDGLPEVPDEEFVSRVPADAVATWIKEYRLDREAALSTLTHFPAPMGPKERVRRAVMRGHTPSFADAVRERLED